MKIWAECGCCGLFRNSLPYQHSESPIWQAPPVNRQYSLEYSYSYCQECRDANCRGPGDDCEVLGLELTDDELTQVAKSLGVDPTSLKGTP